MAGRSSDLQTKKAALPSRCGGYATERNNGLKNRSLLVVFADSGGAVPELHRSSLFARLPEQAVGHQSQLSV